MISFAPLWKTLERKGLSQYQLINTHGVSTGTLDALRKGNSVTLRTIEDLRQILQCPIEDVVEIVIDEQKYCTGLQVASCAVFFCGMSIVGTPHK